MTVNLINSKSVNTFLSVFLDSIQYAKKPTIKFANNNVLKTKSVQQVENSREYIAKAMLEKYFEHRMSTFLLSDKKAPYFEKLKVEDCVEDWAKKRITEGGSVYVFCKDKVPADLIEDIETIRDFLYQSALSYVDKRIEWYKTTQKKDKEIKIKLDTLKTVNEYADFDSLLKAAKNGDAYKKRQEEKRRQEEEFFKKSQQGTELVKSFDDRMNIVYLKTNLAKDFESHEMYHCAGNGDYDDDDDNKDDIILYSLRDEKGHPHVTLEVRNGKLCQCKGNNNQKPKDKYLPYIRDFIKESGFDISGDIKYLGIFKQDGQYYDLHNLPKGFVYKGMLDLSGLGLKHLPDLSHIEVTGTFICRDNFLESLQGAPYKIGGSFYCNSNKLKDLQGAPGFVGEDFYCTYNHLESLTGAPESVGGSFVCIGNSLSSLEGAPLIIGKKFDCSHNVLTTLKGAPQKVCGDFDCSYNQLNSLDYLPDEIGGRIILNNNLFIIQNDQVYDLNNLAPGFVIEGDLDLSGMKLKKLPDLSEVIVEGDFICSDNELESLRGRPKEIGGDFDFSRNNIQEIKWMPVVKGAVIYEGNPLVRSIIEQKRAAYWAERMCVPQVKTYEFLNEKMLRHLTSVKRPKNCVERLNIEELKEIKFGKLK